MKDTTVRKMKVYKGHHYHSYKPHPVIRLKGLYLSKLGFEIGDALSIKLSDGDIRITRQPDTSK